MNRHTLLSKAGLSKAGLSKAGLTGAGVSAAVVLAFGLTATVAVAPAFAAPAAHTASRHTTHKTASHKTASHKSAPHKRKPAKHAEPAHKRPARLTCRAAMTKGRPYQFTTTTVLVTTARGALVQATASYLTTSVTEAGIASKHGVARIPYYTGLSTPWRKVPVTVTVISGSRSASCSTSFTPRLL
jgi:hypothetical protein